MWRDMATAGEVHDNTVATYAYEPIDTFVVSATLVIGTILKYRQIFVDKLVDHITIGNPTNLSLLFSADAKLSSITALSADFTDFKHAVIKSLILNMPDKRNI